MKDSKEKVLRGHYVWHTAQGRTVKLPVHIREDCGEEIRLSGEKVALEGHSRQPSEGMP